MRNKLIAATVAITILALWSPAATAQSPTIGVFSDASAGNCNIVDNGPGVVSVYVVVTASPVGLTAVEFSAPPPGCFDATWVGDSSPFPTTIGDSQAGISVGFGGCYPVPVHVLTMNFVTNGNSGVCCAYPILPSPAYTDIRFVDCVPGIVAGVSLDHTINGDLSCFCGINPPPAVPSNPAPADGRTNASVIDTLTWESVDPEGDPVVFDVYFGTDPAPPLVGADIATPVWSPGILEYNTHYYWKIVARDVYGMVSEGPEWTFRTKNSSTSRLVVASALNYCGPSMTDTVTVAVTIEDALIAIDGGGIDITYDATVLTFVGCEAGDLTQGWPSLSCSDLTTHVQVGGAAASPIPAGTSGTFATLTFISDCCAPDTTVTVSLCAESATGELGALYPVCGQFTCAAYAGDGDVNEDGQVTPGDALCAFEGYLSFPSPPAAGCGLPGWDVRGDVDCNGQITPGDALCVFHSWLDGSCAFCPAILLHAPRILPPVITAGEVVRDGDDYVVIFAVAGAAWIDAFGFDIGYPAGVTSVTVLPAALTADFDRFGERTPVPGRTRVGAYTTSPVAALHRVEFVELRFHVEDGTAPGVVTVGGFVDDLSGAERVSIDLSGSGGDPVAAHDYALHQNQPNPFNPDTRIRYEIPAGAVSGRVTLSVYNIEGKLVRRLVDADQGEGIYDARWDGRADSGEAVSSGVYFYVLRTAQRTIARKMVLLK